MTRPQPSMDHLERDQRDHQQDQEAILALEAL